MEQNQPTPRDSLRLAPKRITEPGRRREEPKISFWRALKDLWDSFYFGTNP